MKVLFSTTFRMVKEFLKPKMVFIIEGSGRRVIQMEKEKKFGSMEQSIKDHI